MSALRYLISFMTAAFGLAVIFLAACIPAYFTSVDRHVVARAGAGVNNIPLDALAERGL